MTSDIITTEWQPSSILLEKIHECAIDFRNHIVSRGKLQNSVNEVYNQAEKEPLSLDWLRIFSRLTIRY